MLMQPLEKISYGHFVEMEESPGSMEGVHDSVQKQLK